MTSFFIMNINNQKLNLKKVDSNAQANLRKLAYYNPIISALVLRIVSMDHRKFYT